MFACLKALSEVSRGGSFSILFVDVLDNMVLLIRLVFGRRQGLVFLGVGLGTYILEFFVLCVYKSSVSHT